MNSRQRVRDSLDHKEPDRVPFDLAGTVITGIQVQAYKGLRKLLGLPPVQKVEYAHMFQQLSVVHDDVRDRLGVDCGPVAPSGSGTHDIEIHTEDDSEYFFDEWRIGWKKPKGHGMYYDMFSFPLIDASSIREIERFDWPNPTDPRRFKDLRQRAEYVAGQERRATILNGMCPGMMELGSWTRGCENFLADFLLNPEMICRFFDIVIDLKIAYWEKAIEAAGPGIDVIQESDDFASQTRLLIDPALFRRHCKPRYRRLFDSIHARSDAKIFFHSCGAIRAVIPDLIEAGVDILNPVQVSAEGMNSRDLKRDFGRDITFWGGGVDTQNVLGTGSPQQVKDDVRRRIDDFAPGGGFVFSAVHNIQGNVPACNILAMWEALREHGQY